MNNRLRQKSLLSLKKPAESINPLADPCNAVLRAADEAKWSMPPRVQTAMIELRTEMKKLGLYHKQVLDSGGQVSG